MRWLALSLRTGVARMVKGKGGMDQSGIMHDGRGITTLSISSTERIHVKFERGYSMIIPVPKWSPLLGCLDMHLDDHVCPFSAEGRQKGEKQ